MARFIDTINEQIGNEFSASQQYVAMAVWYDGETLPRLANFFYKQAVEERNHAMMLVQYLLDAGEAPVVSGAAAPKTTFASYVEPVQMALAQEKKVTSQIENLVRLARKENNLLGEHFLGWFLKEQLEEESSMSALLKTVERAGSQILLAEAMFGHDEEGEDEGESDAPHAAGGAL